MAEAVDVLSRHVRNWQPRKSAGAVARAGVLIALFALVAAAFMPGLMVPDTLDMCNQAMTDHYSTWHSPILAGTWGLFDFSPELIFAAQTIGFIAFSYLIVRRWLKPWVSVAATALITLSPTTLGWLGHIGKDEWATVAVLAAIVFLAQVPRAAGYGRTGWLVLALTALWIAVAARANMIVVVAAMLLAAGDLGFRALTSTRRLDVVPVAKRVGLIALFVLATLGSQRIWIAEVVEADRVFPEQPTYQYDLAALSLRTGDLLLPRSTLMPGADLDSIRAHFSVHGGGGNTLFFASEAPVRFYITDPAVHAEIRDAWIAAIRAHPVDFVRHRLSFTSSLLGISAPYAAGAIFDPGSQPENWALTCPLDDAWFGGLAGDVSSVLMSIDRWHVWRLWWIVLMLVVAGWLAGYRRCLEVRVFVAASAVTVAMYSGAAIAASYRYVWFVGVATLIVMAIACRRVPAFARDPEGAEQGE